MTSREDRDALRTTYEQRPKEAAVCAIRNSVTGRVLVTSTVDLASLRNRLEFGQQTNSTGVLDRRLVSDAREHGVGSFALEVLDVLDEDPLRSDTQTAADLVALEELWHERLTDEPQY